MTTAKARVIAALRRTCVDCIPAAIMLGNAPRRLVGVATEDIMHKATARAQCHVDTYERAC